MDTEQKDRKCGNCRGQESEVGYLHETEWTEEPVCDECFEGVRLEVRLSEAY